MIDKERAVGAAEEILASERHRLAEIQNARAAKVPSWARVPGFDLLEPRHQAAIYRCAERTVQRNTAFQALSVGWLLSMALTWYFAPDDGAAYATAIAMLGVIGVFALRAVFIRPVIRRLLTGHQSWVSCAGSEARPLARSGPLPKEP
jgi:hypothetical protein